MILVSEAGSMRAVAACEAITWPLVSSSSSQALADSSGAGNACAQAPDAKAAASMATANFAGPCRSLEKAKTPPPGLRVHVPIMPRGTYFIDNIDCSASLHACVSAGATRGAGIEHARGAWFSAPHPVIHAACDAGQMSRHLANPLF